MANQYQSILVAVDGSQAADYAFRKSIDVAKRHENSILNIVNIIDSRSFVGYNHSIIDQAQRHSEELLNKYKSQAEAAGVEKVNIIIEHGSPRSIITNDIVASVEADVIICGATGLNTVERFLIGSVSESIVRSATCDVLVIRTPE
ncbi:universal stress protein [Virgibacillus sp. NKC19-3]|uniref:universal stress protein n=1 Tax=Virgibacillus saliphilus TaxID=2831674 RepID=UPI001C9B74F9|nr:universal stress protein [Virgibacillus sp. NKC19-3]MBY7142120.1 universal stress protein [Virgibacillus sp. NKC19-3]